MSNLLSTARKNAVNAFISNTPINQPNHSFYTYRQRHADDCVTACLRMVSDNYSEEAPAGGLTFNEALLVACNFGLYLTPVIDLDLVPSYCILLAVTTDPRKHAYLIHKENEQIVALYDPAEGIVYKGTDVPGFDLVHLALVYKPGPL